MFASCATRSGILSFVYDRAALGCVQDGEVVSLAGALLLELLLAAIGIALNPPAVIAAIVLLSASRGRAVAFSAGWFLGIFASGAAVMVAGDLSHVFEGTSLVAVLVKLVVGGALVVLAYKKWQSHKAAAGEKEMPGWMRTVSDLSAPRAFGAAAAFAAFNPKTLALTIAGVSALLEAPIDLSVQWGLFALFAVLASASVTVPVAFAVLAPRRSADALTAGREWLVDNSSAVAAGVLAVLGAMVLRSGVDSLVWFLTAR